MSAELSESERWVLEQLSDADQHFADLAWLGGDEHRSEDAIEVVQLLLARGYIEVRECYEGDSWSRLLTIGEAKAAISDDQNWPRSTSSRPHWYEASATESGLVAIWGPSERPYRDRYLP